MQVVLQMSTEIKTRSTLLLFPCCHDTRSLLTCIKLNSAKLSPASQNAEISPAAMLCSSLSLLMSERSFEMNDSVA